MTMTNMNVPKLRFPEFIEKWQSFKLGNISNINPKTGNLPNSFYYIDLESVNSGILSNKTYINSENAPSRAQRVLSYEDILFSTVRPYQQNNFYFNIIDDVKYVASTGFAQIKANEDSLFLYYYLHTYNLLNNVLKLCTGTSYPAINFNDLKKIKVNIPSIDEQEKIASFLYNIDKKIGLLKDKKDEYVKFKHYLLQNLFPQNGSCIPKLRFIKYNDEWKTCKLNEVVEIPEKNKITSITNKKLLTVKLHTNGIEINENTVPKLTKKGRPYYIRHTNEILIGRQNFHNGGIGILPEELDGGICSNAITSFNVIKDIALTKYVYYYLSRTDYYKRSEKYIGGTGQKEYSEKTLLSLNISFPSTKEQEKIASFLSFVDKKIDLLDQDIKLVKEYKKGLLQNMFC